MQTRAEALWPRALPKRCSPKNIYFDSAGTDAETTGGANFRAISAMGEYGVDLMNHLAKSITDVAISEFDHVVAMDSNIFDSVMRKYPDMEDRTILWEIEDPFYGTIKTYRSCADEIFQNMKVFATRLGLTELGIYPTSGGK